MARAFEMCVALGTTIRSSVRAQDRVGLLAMRAMPMSFVPPDHDLQGASHQGDRIRLACSALI